MVDTSDKVETKMSQLNVASCEDEVRSLPVANRTQGVHNHEKCMYPSVSWLLYATVQGKAEIINKMISSDCVCIRVPYFHTP